MHYKYLAVSIQRRYNKICFINDLDLLSSGKDFAGDVGLSDKSFFIKWHICIVKFQEKHF